MIYDYVKQFPHANKWLTECKCQALISYRGFDYSLELYLISKQTEMCFLLRLCFVFTLLTEFLLAETVFGCQGKIREGISFSKLFQISSSTRYYSAVN